MENQEQKIITYEKNISLQKKYIFKAGADLLSFFDGLLMLWDGEKYLLEIRITTTTETICVSSKDDFIYTLEKLNRILKLSIYIFNELKNKTIHLVICESESISIRSHIKLTSNNTNWIKTSEVYINNLLEKINRPFISFICSNTVTAILSIFFTILSVYIISAGELVPYKGLYNLLWILYAFVITFIIVNISEFGVSKFKFKLKRKTTPSLSLWLNQDYGHKITFMTFIVAVASIIISILK